MNGDNESTRQACLGGAALHSSTHKEVLAGIELADSMAWCWHKVINAPFQTSLVMCRHEVRWSFTYAGYDYGCCWACHYYEYIVVLFFVAVTWKRIVSG